MSEPTSDEHKAMFTALVQNGFDFFLRSAHELDKEQKFAIAHFATGLELILKAWLFQKDWKRIATKRECCAWTSIRDGTVRTLRASDLCAAIERETKLPLTREKPAFATVFQHRNQVLHWRPDGDLASTVAEQCKAWHYLRALLTGPWRNGFRSFGKHVDDVEQALRAHRSYLESGFEQFKQTPDFEELEKAGRLLVCSMCDFRAGVAEDTPDRVVWYECRVCGGQHAAARFSCGALFALDALRGTKCECGNTHDWDSFIDELDPPGPKGVLHRGYCGNCYFSYISVVPDHGSYVCVVCETGFSQEDSTSCEWCKERWYGRDLEGSRLSGCGFCGGSQMDDD